MKKLKPALELAVAHHRARRLDEARLVCRELLRREPDHLKALSLLGRLELDAGKPLDAVAAFERLVTLAPASAANFSNLGVAHHRSGALEQAMLALLRAVQLDSQRTEALQNLGLVLLDLEKVDEGLRCLLRASELAPSSWSLKRLCALELARANRFDAAVPRLRELLARDPQALDISLPLLSLLEKAERWPEAQELARGIVRSHPTALAGHLALGRILAKEHEYSEAVVAFQAALATNDAAGPGLVTLGLSSALAKLGRLDEAMQLLERRVEADPSLSAEHSSLVFLSAFHPRYDAQSLLELARSWSNRHARPLIGRRKPHGHDRSPERRLRVAYLSPDFRGHVQRLFTLPVFRQHDHTAHEIVCYSGAKTTDHFTEQLKRCADEWHDVSRLGDGELAQRIREDRIDVLVDLTMHMAANRLKTLAEKPAPVQIAWLAYPGTTGLDGIDYRITDPFLDPPGASLPYAEESLRLPHSFWCYGPEDEEGTVNELPRLASGYPTFGCLNTFTKVNRGTLELWARVLAAVPGSKFLLLAPAGSARDFARGTFLEHGIALERLEFVGFQARAEYLETYHRIDIALDTSPYNGHTTSLDAYWMGVPVVTLLGKTVAGRAGSCLAHNLDLAAWVARDAEQFVAIAAEFSADVSGLRALRKGLRQRLKASPLMDAAGFARALEAAYRAAWRRWCESPRTARHVEAGPLDVPRAGDGRESAQIE